MARKFHLPSAIVGALRRIAPRTEAYRNTVELATVRKPRFKKDGTRHKVDLVFITCAGCSQHKKINDINVDHIEPIGPYPGSRNAPPDLTWDEYIFWMLEDEDNMQALCKSCHTDKTKRERTKAS